MLAFQVFQYQMADHLRDPHHTRRPSGVSQRRMGVYNELLFNKVCGFVDSCFPVCRQILGETRWRRLCRIFYRDWPLHTPWFREIPLEFVRCLQAHRMAQPLPPWLADLAYYEWAELAVDVMDVTLPAHHPDGDLMQGRVLVNPARVDVVSPWPVHRIGPAWQPRKKESSYLLVFRDPQNEVQFTHINALTARVVRLLEEGCSGQQCFAQMAQEMQHPQPEALQSFGQQLLIGLRKQGVLLGTCT